MQQFSGAPARAGTRRPAGFYALRAPSLGLGLTVSPPGA